MKDTKQAPLFKDGVSKEQALKEVENWLNYKKVSSNQRTEHTDHIEALADYISSGVLILEEDFGFTHKLLFPIGIGESITELKYKARMNPKILKPYLSGVKSTDANGMLYAHIGALTGQSTGIITELDQEDMKVSRSIAVFFV